MTIHKHGSAHWSGDIKRGKGTVSTESGVLNQQPYGFNTRFEGAKGTNPEELIGAAVFLSSKASDFVNGHLLFVDGGMLVAV